MFGLAIETSCDETAAAIIDFDESGNFSILSEAISSQVKLHELYGGVVPELASREHLSNLPVISRQVLDEAGLSIGELSFVGVTRGPGLKGCLLIGLCFARGIALTNNIPVLGVNHIEGHILSPLIENPSIETPFLALVVSGGHTEIVRVDAVGKYQLVAKTTDDAAGEAFDKAASLLGLPYPGGPMLAKLADESKPGKFVLPKVMREAAGFSFSGLKTAISLLIKQNKERIEEDPEALREVCAAIQDSIVDAIVYKLKRAIQETGIKRICVSGGVSANRYLRDQLSALSGIDVHFPSLAYCTDNAAMIANVAFRRFLKGERLSADAEPLSRWPVTELQES